MAHQLPVPDKVVTYPISSEPDGGALFLYGNPDAPLIALISAGFPDDHECFQTFAARLANEANCLAGVTCLPGYDDRENFPYTKHKIQGYSFNEMTGAMREAAKTLRKESTYKGDGGAKLIGIYHDWGVFPGMIYSNRCIAENNEDIIPDRIVLFDVMGPPHPKMKNMPIAPKDTLYEKIVTWTYRIIFAKAFFIRAYVSKVVAQVYAGFAFTFLGLFKLGPTYDIDDKVFESRQKPISFDRMLFMAYPYFKLFKAMFTGDKKQFYGSCLPLDLGKTPVLYMYGTHKRIMFHDKKALMVLEEEEKKGHKSKAFAVEGAGHWLYIQKPDICMEEVVKFVTDA